MFSGLADLAHAWVGFMNPTSIALGLGGALLGIIVGILPGLSATLVIALLTTITIKLPANDAILVLICSYVGALYGGSRTAILLNIPGTAANAASCADGYALAQRGEAGRAIGIATSGAFTGTLFGVLCLAAFTPSLAEVALAFGAYEFFWLALFGVAMSGSIVGDDPVKGWLMGALGLFVAQIGQEGLYAYDRFTFGWDEIAGGIGLIPALVGAFGLAEILTNLADPLEKKLVEVKDSVLPRFREVFQYWRTGPALRRDRRPHRPPARRRRGLGRLDVVRRGEGDEQGEAPLRQGLDRRPDGRRDRRHGVDPRPHHPCLALGIPGSAPSAVLMAAMIIHGIQPGPMMMIQHPHFVYEVVAMTSLATITILIFGLFLVRPLLVVLRIRRTVLMPVILLLCTVGAFATASRLFDVYAMLVIGIGAFFLRRRGYQMAPFVLGLVLGPLLDKSLRRGLVLSDGSVAPFFTRPISLAFAVVTIFAILLYVPAFKAAGQARHRRRRRGGALAGAAAHLTAIRMKLALCNEVLGELSLEAQCELAARLGYDGSRSRPFTLANAPERIDAAEARRIRGVVEAAGLVVTGLHWLLVKPSGLSVTDPDPARAAHARRRHPADRPLRRARRQGAGARLAEAARGRSRRNPRHRPRPPARLPRRGGRGRGGARRRLLHRAAVAERDAAVNTVAEAARSCARSDRPSLRTMIDCSAAGLSESVSVPELIDTWLPTGLIGHMQVNDPEPARARPGRDAVRADLRALKRHGYAGTVAVEPFDYVPDGPGCAAYAAGYLRGVRESLS
jgi:putative tricarboxylic transport membrane protein